MTRFMKYLMTIGFLSILLVACGTNTDSTNSENDSTKDNKIEQTVEETETEQELEIEKENEVPQQEVEKEPEEEPKEKESIEEQSPATEVKISYSFNGESKQENASWKKSDNQAFGLYILPTYELSAEEPNKDVLYYKEDDLHFMRIEILPGDSDQNSLKENTLAQLQAVNEDVQTLSPDSDEFFQNATIMQTKKDKDIVRAYLIQQDDKIIKLTIFTNDQENHQDAFIQMAKELKVN